MSDKSDNTEKRLTDAYGTAVNGMPTATREAFTWLARFAPEAVVGGLVEGFERLNMELSELNPEPDTDAIVAAVRVTLALDAEDVTGVVFTATEYDDGYYLDETGMVFYADGTTDYYEFPVHDELTDGYGRVGGQAALAVRLSDGVVEYDDNRHAVYQWLGVDKIDKE